jgi:RNA polymerase sigma-70 factor, ECF subfamily
VHVEEQSVERYIWENRDSFYRLSYSYVGNQADALDIVSESIVKALSTRRRLKDSKAVKTWFYRVVANTAIDFVRKHKRVIYVDDIAAQDSGQDDPYADIDLQRAMACLPDKYRIIIILRYFEDLPIEKIAAVLSQNVNTIKGRLYKALEMLKAKLSDDQSIFKGGKGHE